MNIVNRIINSFKTRFLRNLFIYRFNKIGHIDKNTKLAIIGEFKYGSNVTILGEGIDNVTRSQIVVLPGAILQIGDNTGMSQVSITCKCSIIIGDYVTIGAGTMIYDTNFHCTDWRIRRTHSEDLESSKNAPVIIENDVFIGARSIICKGVTIGARSIIAAGSVVVKDIPADCIAGGNPCRVINYIEEDKHHLAC